MVTTELIIDVMNHFDEKQMPKVEERAVQQPASQTVKISGTKTHESEAENHYQQDIR